MESPEFVKEIKKLQPLQADQDGAVREVLTQFLGETAARLIIKFLGDDIHDPRMLAQRMSDIFGFGANIILRGIVQKCKDRSLSPANC